MPKYRVKVEVFKVAEITIEAPNKETAKACLNNDIKINEDQWEFDKKVHITVKEDINLETPQFKLDNGLLMDYDTPEEIDD